MAVSISDFRSTFNVDVARPSRFDVNIPVPLALATYITSARNLSFRCENAVLPGRSFETADKKMGSAPIEKFPYHTQYQEATFTFIVSDDMNEKLFFDAWQELMNPSGSYNFQYKANYAVDITVNQYDVSNNLTYAGVLQEAFPIDVNQLDLDWSTDSYHKLSVVFCYRQWNNNSVQNILKNAVTSGLSGVVNLF